MSSLQKYETQVGSRILSTSPSCPGSWVRTDREKRLELKSLPYIPVVIRLAFLVMS